MLRIDGWDMAPIKSGDEQYPRNQGELIGLDVSKGRNIDIHFWVAPISATKSIAELIQTIANAIQVQGAQETGLWINLPGYGTLGVTARPRKMTYPIDLDYSAASLAKPVVRWHATDPLLYGPAQTVTIAAGGGGTGGATFPITFPLKFPGVAEGATLAQSGNFYMFPIFVFTGPLTTPSLIIAGQTFTLSNGSNPTIPNGETVTVDTHTHSVLLNVTGTSTYSSVRSWVTPSSVFPLLSPGNSVASLSAASGSTGSVTIQWAAATWL